MDQSERKARETTRNEGYLPPFDSIDNQSLARLFGRDATLGRDGAVQAPPPAAQDPNESVTPNLSDEHVEHQNQEAPVKPQLDTSSGEVGNTIDAPHAAGDPYQNSQGRAARAREKQRANRRAKRAARREASALKSQESATPVDDASRISTEQGQTNSTAVKYKKSNNHHRPTPSERSMIFFIKIYEWSNLFFCDLDWPTYLQRRAAYHSSSMTVGTQVTKVKRLDTETIRAISQAVKADWQAAHKVTRRFRSTADLERFAQFKEEEAAYIEKQLAAIPEVRDQAWESFFCEVPDPYRLKAESAGERVELPIEFIRDTLLPCLRAQVQTLKARVEKARGLEKKYEVLRESYQRQRELRETLGSLQQDQVRLLPICPVWKEVEAQVMELRAEMMAQEAFLKLSHDNELARLAYEDALVFDRACIS